MTFSQPPSQATLAADFIKPTPLQVLLRYAAALAGALLVFVLYDFTIVPWIEPPARITRRPEIDPLPYYPREVTSEGDIQRLFSADAWERGNPKILRTDQGTLLFKDYETQDDGRLDLKPVTLVIPMSQNAGESARQIVMQAPEGAVLQFDGSLTLAGRSGRLIGGKLRGTITVWSPESRPGMGDDLWATTQDIRIQPDRIETTSPVEFRFGEHYGSGRHLLIGMAPEPTAGDANQRLGVGTARSVELVHVDRVRVFMPGRGGLLGSVRPTLRDDNPNLVRPPVEKVPVDLTCAGSFQFDLQEYIASFEKQVELVRLDPSGVRDQLSCDLLSIHFAHTDGSPAEATQNPDRDRSQIEKIVCRGAPILLRAPSQDIDARAQQFEYNLKTRTIRLNDPRQVTLRRGDQLVEAPRLDYVMAVEDGRLGQLWAPGPGRFRGRPRPESALVTATWEQEIRLEAHEGRHVLSLLSGVGLESAELGSFTSNELHVWLREVPRAAAPAQPRGPNERTKSRYELLPEQLLATGRVKFDTPRLAGVTERVEMRIDHLSAARPPVESASPPPTRPRAGGTFGLVSDRGSDPQAGRKFQLTGQNVKLHVQLRGKEQLLEQAYLGQDAQIVELSQIPGHLPLQMTGSSLELSGGSSDHPRIVLRGWPEQLAADGSVATEARRASVSAEGLTLMGPDIHVDQGENRVWIEGPGEMQLVSGLGRAPGKVRVNWRADFDFDGQTATARDDVRVQGRYSLDDGEYLDFTATGPELQATLTTRLNLRAPDAKQRAAAQRLLFRGPVDAESRTFATSDDAAGVQQSFEQMHVTNLEIDQVTGRLHAEGPGSVNTVRFGKSVSRKNDQRVVFEQDERPDRLFYLNVDYNREIIGNVLNREVSFLNLVRAVYGPVAQWEDQVDPEQVTGRRTEGAVLTCQQLSVAEMGTRQEPSLELDASGNTQVEGQENRGYFTAAGHHLKYVQNKDLMILEGDGRNDAVVSVQQAIGAPPQTTRLRRIVFQPHTGDMQLDGLNSGDYRESRPSIRRPPRSSAVPPGRMPVGRRPIGYR